MAAITEVHYFISFLFVSVLSVISNVQAQGFLGRWELVSNNSGVSAMHVQLLPKTSKMLMYDATLWNVSQIHLPPEKMPCRLLESGQSDCWAHAVLYDVETERLYPLKVTTDTWCSSGGLTVDGILVGTGGFKTGANVVRYLDTCENCDFREFPAALAEPRWYSTQVTLADGSFVVVGGRDAPSWEYIPPEGESNLKATPLPFLKDTTEYLFDKYVKNQKDFRLENNLYPFVYLVPDGNLYIFANNRSILFDPRTDTILREYPALPGGARNYPGTAASALLPIRIPREMPNAVGAEVLICGGSRNDAYFVGEVIKRDLPPALQDCARMVLTSPDSVWKIEMMPSPRVMGDMVNLPTGDMLIVNGAKLGSGGWHCNDEPNRVPVLYNPNGPEGGRFTELAPSNIDRMYHSVAALIPDGRVLIGGSNDNDGYVFNAKFPTELRIEKFSPPYLDPEFAWRRPFIVFETSDKSSSYEKPFSLKVKSPEPMMKDDQLEVTIYSPPFVTHSVSMNQRLIVLNVAEVKNDIEPGVHELIVLSPPSSRVAPAGYYLATVCHKGIPSPSMWFQFK